MHQVIFGLSRLLWIYLGTVIASVLIWQLLQTKVSFAALSNLLGGHEATATEVVAFLMGFALLGWLIWFTATQCSRVEAQRMWVLFSLTAVSALFWGLYEQTYGAWVAIADRAMNLDDLNTPLYTWNAGATTFFGGFFVVLMAPIFAMLGQSWMRLSSTQVRL
ncbi:peptide MFS transporter [bacterium]|nr:peptide MFS transporter [bacterium]